MDFVKVPVGTLPDGSHFWDDEDMTEGAIRVRVKTTGMLSVTLRRWRPSGAPTRERTTVDPSWLVVPGDMPSNVKNKAVKEFNVETEKRRKVLARSAAEMAQKQLSVEYIAGQLGCGEETARMLIAEGVPMLNAATSDVAPAPAPQTTSKEAPTPLPAQPRGGLNPGPTQMKEVKAGTDPKALVDAKAWQLRCEGLSFRQIALRIGYASNASARNAMMRGKEAAGK